MRNFLLKRAAAPLVLILGCLLVSACNKQEKEPAPVTSAGAASDAGGGQLKVAFVYSGPVGDGGWTYAHDQARKTVEAALPERIKTRYVENVAEGPGAEKVFRELAQQGNRVIFGTTFGYSQAMHKVAQDFPEVKFVHATGDRTAPNLSTYAARTYEGAFLAGMMAGKVTTTDTLGFVASVPIPEVIRNINAFTLGAQAVNPQVKVRVEWAQSWMNPERERASALALIQQGADILIQNTDSPAVLKTAQEKGVMAFGWDSDMNQYGPRAHLGSAVIDWAPYYEKVIKDVLAGKWQPEAVWLGARENVVRIASPNPALAQELILLLGEKTHDLKSGKLAPFAGPLVDRDGRELVAAGSNASDDQLRSMHVFVKGVIGNLPQ